MKSISLLELARLAGVSKTTASLVLNKKADKHKISKTTQERVVTIARQENYKPNLLARNLSTGKSMTVGLIVHKTNDCVTGEMIELLEMELAKYEYRIVLGCSYGDVEQEQILIADMIERHVDGLLIIPANGRDDKFIEFEDGDMPIIYLSKSYKESHLPSVIFDADSGIKQIISFWYTKTRRTIGYIGTITGNAECRKSYHENYIERFSMKSDYMTLLKNEDDEKKLERSLTFLAGKGVNAILFESPALAYSALKAVNKLDKLIYKDISFGCYGYHPAFEVAEKQIIYIKLPNRLLAEKATELLIDMINKKDVIATEERIEPEFLF